MQVFFTVLFETVAVSAFAMFAIAFICGFATYTEQASRPGSTVPDVQIDIEQVMAGYEAYHQPAAALDWGKVAPFSRPYRRTVSAPIDWAVWSADDLRLASQRKPFDIPLRLSGKKLSKAALVERYQAALGLATAAA